MRAGQPTGNYNRASGTITLPPFALRPPRTCHNQRSIGSVQGIVVLNSSSDHGQPSHEHAKTVFPSLFSG